MTTKNEFHVERVWGQSPDPIFLKMQQNIHLKALSALTTIRQDGDKYEFEYNVSSFLSVETLISTQRFNMRLFTHLLKTLENLELQLEQYMLTGEMLIYREDALFFDPSADQFIWLLLPFERNEKTVKKEQLHFFRHMIIELELCDIPNINILLLETHFSVLEIKKQFLTQVDKLDSNLKIRKEGTKVGEKAVGNHFLNKMLNRKGNNKGEKTRFVFFKLNTKKANHLPKMFQSPQEAYMPLNLKKTAYIQRHPILISRDQPAIQYKVYYETCLIGRDDRCEINIDEISISREHAKLYTQGTQYLIEDLDSTNGTFVNNKKILNKTPISHGDELRIGHCDFIFLL